MIRPVKGLEPYLYECLASTLRQDYPQDKLTVYLCVASRKDPAFPTVQKVAADFADRDVHVMVEEEDSLLQEGSGYSLGPNPKIRNMSRAYREAKGDIVWIVDCNVWVGKGVCGRMVDRLCGFGGNKKYRFVHHLPIAVAVDGEDGAEGSNQNVPADERQPLLADRQQGTRTNSNGGGRLEELFLSSSHAKMYTAINTVQVAPCIVGKSSMFRRSHLNFVTGTHQQQQQRDQKVGGARPRNPGIDCISDHLCEDHIIGDWLWRFPSREELESGEPMGRHAQVFGDYAFQPVAGMSVRAYIARRVRWQRVRKFTVLAATFVEPGTESILCSLYGAFALTTLAPPPLRDIIASGWPAKAWTFAGLWLTSMLLWVVTDRVLYRRLHSAATVEVDEHTPAPFARQRPRSFLPWLAAWIGREALAFPIWFWAFYGGSTVVWRNRKFRVSPWDTRAREVPTPRTRRTSSADSSYLNGAVTSSSSATNGNKSKLRKTS